MENIIVRKEYLDALISYKDKKVIKVVTGIRRSGKSTLLFELFINWLRTNGVDKKQIIAIDLELKSNAHLLDEQKLYDHIKERLVPNTKNYCIIDEVQNCVGFQKVVSSLHKEGVDMYITGSNAFILSGELATLLSGRYVQIKMLPLSFKEFVEATSGKNQNLELKYREYTQFGGFPYIREFDGDEKQIRDYLDAIYNTIFKKDIIDRHQILNPIMLEDVLKFVFDNIGNLLSPKKISDTMTSNNRKISQPTIENYLNYFAEAFLVYKANRFDIKGKEYLKFNAKYYVVDMGLRNYLLNYHNIDRGKMLENIVYLELLRRGYTVAVGKIADREVDFVASMGGDTIYIQIAETVKSSETLDRELAPFKLIKDFNKRVLFTLDYDTNRSYDGIKHINALEYLIGKEDF